METLGQPYDLRLPRRARQVERREIALSSSSKLRGSAGALQIIASTAPPTRFRCSRKAGPLCMHDCACVGDAGFCRFHAAARRRERVITIVAMTGRQADYQLIIPIKRRNYSMLMVPVNRTAFTARKLETGNWGHGNDARMASASRLPVRKPFDRSLASKRLAATGSPADRQHPAQTLFA